MRFLLLNQTFWPDVAATAQYLTEVALELAGRGHQVTVITGRRAYDSPDKLFPSEENWRGIRIIRIGSTGFGKGARWRRAADFASFYALCSLRLAFLPRHDAVVALTTPPLISFLGAWVARVRRARFYYWVMDFNPDEAIAAGWLRAGSPAAKLLEAFSRFSLRQATRIFALDHFMRDRIAAKGIPPDKIAVLPPWSHDGDVAFDAAGRTRFRQAHGLEDKFVVMYSGNHSPVHPLDTVLQAADRLRDDKDIVFLFVGGGSEWRKINALSARGAEQGGKGEEQGARRQVQRAKGEEEGGKSKAQGVSHLPPTAYRLPPAASLRCLPYQPLSDLSASLSAADLHLVVMGNAFVGLVHPCKIYNILSVGAPVLYIGPEPSHVSELLDSLGNGYFSRSARHGDVDAVVQAIRDAQRARREAQGARGQEQGAKSKGAAACLAPGAYRLPPPPLLPPPSEPQRFSKSTILPQMIALLERNR